MARRKRRSFTPEDKAEAVRLVQVGDRSVREVAKRGRTQGARSDARARRSFAAPHRCRRANRKPDRSDHSACAESGAKSEAAWLPRSCQAARTRGGPLPVAKNLRTPTSTEPRHVPTLCERGGDQRRTHETAARGRGGRAHAPEHLRAPSRPAGGRAPSGNVAACGVGDAASPDPWLRRPGLRRLRRTSAGAQRDHGAGDHEKDPGPPRIAGRTGSSPGARPGRRRLRTGRRVERRRVGSRAPAPGSAKKTRARDAAREAWNGPRRVCKGSNWTVRPAPPVGTIIAIL